LLLSFSEFVAQLFEFVAVHDEIQIDFWIRSKIESCNFHRILAVFSKKGWIFTKKQWFL
jgi:hypothetical protein